MNRFVKHILLLLLFVAATTSCERRPLLEISNTRYVRVYIDEEIKNVTYGFYNPSYLRPAYKTPDVMRVTLADPITGKVKAERFLRDKGKDERGTYYEGYIVVEPGEYTLMAYNFDTEAVHVDQEYNIEDTKVYTNEIASYLRAKISSRGESSSFDNERIVYEPDNLFRTVSTGISIPYSETVDTIYPVDSECFLAQNVVKSYYMQVRVKGIQYAASTVGLLTGLSGSCRLIDGNMDTKDSITVYFELSPNAAQGVGFEDYAVDGGGAPSDSVVTLYTTFNTFGKIPDAKNQLQITFDFITVYGKSYSETFDISKAFATPEGINNNWLLIDHMIEIPAPPPVTGNGGFNPDIDDWDDINTDIKI